MSRLEAELYAEFVRTLDEYKEIKERVFLMMRSRTMTAVVRVQRVAKQISRCPIKATQRGNIQ